MMSRLSPGNRRGSKTVQPASPPVPPKIPQNVANWQGRMSGSVGPMPGPQQMMMPVQAGYPADQRRLSSSNVVMMSPPGAVDNRRLSLTNLVMLPQPQPITQVVPAVSPRPIQLVTAVAPQTYQAPIEQPRSVQAEIVRVPSVEQQPPKPRPPSPEPVVHRVERRQLDPQPANVLSSKEVRVTELRPSGDPLIYRNHINGDRGLPPPAPPVSTFRSMYHNEPKRPSSGLIRQVGIGMLVVKRFLSHWEPYHYNEHKKIRSGGPHGIEGQPSLQIAGLLASNDFAGLSATHSVSEYDEEGAFGVARINRVYVPGGGAAVSTRAFQLFVEELLPDYGAKLSRQVEIGDEILAVNDVPVTSVDEVKRMTIGDERSTCRLTLRRHGRAIDVAVVRVCPDRVANNYVHGQICSTRLAKVGVPLRPTIVSADNNTDLTHAMRDYPKDAKAEVWEGGPGFPPQRSLSHSSNWL